MSPKAESGAQVRVKACTSAKDAGGYPEETTTRVVPLGKIVVATEVAPASHDDGAGITVPARGVDDAVGDRAGAGRCPGRVRRSGKKEDHQCRDEVAR